MSHSHDEQELIHHLHDALQANSKADMAQTSDGLDREILSIPNAMEEAVVVSPSSGRMIFVLAAAAVIVMSIGVYASGWLRSDIQNEKEVELVSTSNISKDNVYILRLQPDEKLVTGQSLQSFAIVQRRPGELINGRILKDVTDNTIFVQSSQGKIDIVSSATINEESMLALSEECSMLRDLHINRSFGTENLERLGQIAQFGQSEAIRLLESIAATPSPMQQQAIDMLTAGQGLKAIQSLVKMSLQGKERFRRQAVASLSKVQAPLAMECLKTIVSGSDFSMANYVIKESYHSGQLHSWTLLRHAASHGQDPEVRNSAQRHLNKMVPK